MSIVIAHSYVIHKNVIKKVITLSISTSIPHEFLMMYCSNISVDDGRRITIHPLAKTKTSYQSQSQSLLQLPMLTLAHCFRWLRDAVDPGNTSAAHFSLEYNVLVEENLSHWLFILLCCGERPEAAAAAEQRYIFIYSWLWLCVGQHKYNFKRTFYVMNNY